MARRLGLGEWQAPQRNLDGIVLGSASWFLASSSTNYFDKWTDHGFFISRVQMILSFAYAGALCIGPKLKNGSIANFESSLTQKIVAFLPALLALSTNLLFKRYCDPLQRTCIFTASESVQLLSFWFLSIAQWSNAPNHEPRFFFIGFVTGIIPASIAVAHGVTGIHTVCGQYRQSIGSGGVNSGEPVDILVEDDGLLAQAYQLQCEARRDDAITPLQQEQYHDESEGESSTVQLVDAPAPQSRLANASPALDLTAQGPCEAARVSPHTARFPWQFRLKTVETGGSYWIPLYAMHSLLIFGLNVCMSLEFKYSKVEYLYRDKVYDRVAYRYAANFTDRQTRIISVAIGVMSVFSTLPPILLRVAAKHSSFTLIFAALCSVLAASMMWLAGLIFMIFFTNVLLYWIIGFMSLALLLNSCLLVPAARLEWLPDCESFYGMYRRLRGG